MAAHDLTGLKFGRLTAIRREGTARDGCVLWLCQCECGTETIVKSSNLMRHQTKSCGCLVSEKARQNVKKAHKSVRKYFGCKHCGSDQHYAKGYCRNCYLKAKRGTLKSEMNATDDMYVINYIDRNGVLTDDYVFGEDAMQVRVSEIMDELGCTADEILVTHEPDKKVIE